MERSVEILHKLKQIFPQTVMLQLYYALVHMLPLCGIIIRGSCILLMYKKLKSLQNRAIRAVVDACFQDLVNPYYSKLKFLQIDDFPYIVNRIH